MKLATTALIALAVQPALFSQATPKLSLKLERIQGKGISDHAVLVAVRVTNISQQTVEASFSVAPEIQYAFSVVGPDGRPAPPTRDAEELSRTMLDRVLIPLAAGESRVRGYTPLSDLVDFSRPGTNEAPGGALACASDQGRKLGEAGAGEFPAAEFCKLSSHGNWSNIITFMLLRYAKHGKGSYTQPSVPRASEFHVR